jgi:hypothetical protein
MNRLAERLKAWMVGRRSDEEDEDEPAIGGQQPEPAGARLSTR